jgi:hypothetical protein
LEDQHGGCGRRVGCDLDIATANERGWLNLRAELESATSNEETFDFCASCFGEIVDGGDMLRFEAYLGLLVVIGFKVGFKCNRNVQVKEVFKIVNEEMSEINTYHHHEVHRLDFRERW